MGLECQPGLMFESSRTKIHRAVAQGSDSKDKKPDNSRTKKEAPSASFYVR